MNFIISSTELYHHVTLAYGAVVKNPVVSILENLLFSIESGNLTITGSNLETSIVSSTSDLEVENEGALAVKANLLIDTLRDMPEQPLEFSYQEDEPGVIKVQSTHGNYKIPVEQAADYPVINTDISGNATTFNSIELADAISKTIFASSNDEMRLNMAGLLFDMNSDELSLVATDAHKLVKYRIQNFNASEAFEAILPKKAVRLLKNLLMNSDSCECTFSRTSAFFKIGEITMVSRVIEQAFPNYRAAIPQKTSSYMLINRLDLLRSLKRTSNFASQSTNQVNFDIDEDQLQVMAIDPDFNSEAKEVIKCEFSSNERLQISFNSVFLVELIQSHDQEFLRFEFTNPKQACLIFPDVTGEDRGILNLIMPVAYVRSGGEDEG